MKTAQVLIVENDGIIAMDIESQLKQLGYVVTGIVGYGEEAIAKVKENKPDVVLMDIVLKGEVDGIQAAEEIRTQTDIPIIFLTGFIDKERLKRAKLSYPFGFIIKPFQNKDLEVTIEMALYIAKVDAERRKAEEALMESKALLEKTFASLDESVFVVDPNTRTIVNSNPAMERIFGYSQEEVIGRNTEFLHVDQAKYEDFGRELFPSLNKSGVYHAEFQMRRKDGSVFYTGHTVTEILDASGNRTGVVSVVKDISERKQAEEALRQAHDELEQRVEKRTAELVKANEQLKNEIDERKRTEEDLQLYREIIENMAEGVCLIRTSDGAIVYTNQQFERMFGYGSEELKGKHVSIVNAPTEKAPEEIAEEIIQSLKEKGVWSGKVKNIKKDGTPFWCYANVSTFDHYEFGEVWISVHEDITVRKQAEEGLKKSEEKYRTLFEVESDALFLVDEDTGNLLEANEAACKLYGYSHEELVGLKAWDLSAEPEKTKKTIALVEKTFLPIRYHKKKDGTVFPVEINANDFTLDGSKINFSAIRDITVRKQAEEALKERTRELELQKKSLEELNTAMKVLLKKREEDKTEIEENVMTNVKVLIAPYFDKINETKLDDYQKAFLNILESNLNEIVSPFTRKLSLKYLSLTPREITIVNMIKIGYQSKKIAKIMKISPRTVDTHRKNIRSKIGLGQKRANLRSHLLAYEQ